MTISSIKTTKRTMWIWTTGSDDFCLEKEDILELEEEIKRWKKKYKIKEESGE